MEWWNESTALWGKHRTSSMTLSERVDYQHTLSAQFPAAPIRVVYTKSGTRLTAGVVLDGSAVIDHALYWAPVAGMDEARYLQTVLNAAVTQAEVEPYQSRGQQGARHYDMYVWQLPIPRFDGSSELHAELVELGRGAEDVAADVDVSGVGFQAGRTRVRKELDAAGLSEDMEDQVARLLGVERV
ncbi:hypothetical protein ACO0LV_05290 [Pseudactinotalea sp. Z1739]|uniref:hypothetical protein n=1 Tax=Pseudactinotalea sp. Z1739 TaxID=3413028 RepID=UPI003C7D7BE2